MPADSIRTLLEGIVDYAGTYPPAGLPLRDAVGTYARARAGAHGWLLGRCVVPATRLDELLDMLPEQGDGEHRPWPLSAVAGPDATAAIEHVLRFVDRRAGRAWIAAVEFAPAKPSEIARLASATGSAMECFFEVPLDRDAPARLDAIGAAGGFAKVRTGGVSAGAFPSAASLAEFIMNCAERGLGFKATAGLHHAVRGPYAVTYEPGSATSTMHGFVNVAVAAAVACARATSATVAEVLDESSPSAFAVRPGEIGWRQHVFPLEELAEARRFFRAFGSCSVREPIDEVAGLGFLR